MTQASRKTRLLYVILAIFIQMSFLPAQGEALCMARRALGVSCCAGSSQAGSPGAGAGTTRVAENSCCGGHRAPQSDNYSQESGDLSGTGLASGGQGGRRAPCSCKHRLPDTPIIPDVLIASDLEPLTLPIVQSPLPWILAYQAEAPIHLVPTRARTGPPLHLLHQVYLI